MCLLKFVLIADIDIIPVNRPHDDFWYIAAADAWIWTRPYDQYAIAHLPVYALVIALNGLTGFPFRLTSEMLLMAGALSLVLALGRAGMPRIAQLGALALILFHPHATDIMNYSLAEVGAAILLLFLVGEFARLVLAPQSRWHAMGFGLCVALVWYTRRESAPLLSGFLLCIAVALVAIWLWRSRAAAFEYAKPMLLAPIAITAVVGGCLYAANGTTYGIWGATDVSAPNFLRAYNALQAIAIERPIRFVPITKEARQKAYEVSPAFAELRPLLDGAVENWGATAARAMGLNGEIGAGWVHWSLRSAVDGMGYYRSSDKAEEYYGRVADELEAAFRSGTLPRRRSLVPFVDPAWRTWAPFVPDSVWRVAKVLYPDHGSGLGPRTAGGAISATYNRVARLRDVSSVATVTGWIIPPGDAPVVIDAVGEDGVSVQSTVRLTPRPDLVPIAASRPNSGVGVAFALTVSDGGANAKIRLRTRNAETLSEPLGALPVLRPFELGPGILLAIERIDLPPPSWRPDVRAAVAEWYPKVFLALAWIGVVWSVVSLWGRQTSAAQAVIAGAILTLVASRVVLFGFIDASAWPGTQPRYIFPASLLFVALPFVLIGSRRNRERSNAAARETPLALTLPP